MKPQPAAFTKSSIVMPNTIVKLLLPRSPSQITIPMLNKAIHAAKFQMQSPDAMYSRSLTVILRIKDIAGKCVGDSFLMIAGERCEMA
jgi:hypothetical protein